MNCGQEVRAYMFCKKGSYNELGWVFCFNPTTCKETDLTIELIEYEKFVEGSSGKEGFRKDDLIPLSTEVFNEWERLFVNGCIGFGDYVDTILNSQ